MGAVSAFAFACNLAELGTLDGMTQQTKEQYLATVPIVSLFAPLGILIAAWQSSRVMVWFVCVASVFGVRTPRFAKPNDDVTLALPCPSLVPHYFCGAQVLASLLLLLSAWWDPSSSSTGLPRHRLLAWNSPHGLQPLPKQRD